MSHTPSPGNATTSPQYLSVDDAEDYNQWRESILNQLSRQIDLLPTEWILRDGMRPSREAVHNNGSRAQTSSISTRRAGDHATFAELTGRASARNISEDTTITPPVAPRSVRLLNTPVRELSPQLMDLSQFSSADARDAPDDVQLDLRELEYVGENDSNLTCPICQVPFVDPIVLECDHTFCKHCLDTWMNAGPNTDAMKCPACRRHHFNMFQKASRLVVNMCDEVVVRCPSNGCTEVMARNHVRQHLQTTCEEILVSCKDPGCVSRVRRKVRDANGMSCLHGTHSECDRCGWLFEKEGLTNHKDACRNTTHGSNQHNRQAKPSCPGQRYGCDASYDDADLEVHTKQCVFAKLAPAMEAQSAMIRSLHDQLSTLTYKNRLLEESFDQLNKLVRHTLRPKIDHLTELSETDVEEIPRESSLSTTEYRLLTPNSASTSVTNDLTYQHDHQQLLHLQDSLQHRITDLEHNLANLEHHHTTSTAQHDLALHNHALSTRQELAYMQGVAHRTQTAVQWLMNRERTTIQTQTQTQTQRDPMAGGRGRQHSRQNTSGGSSNPTATMPAPSNITESSRVLADRPLSEDQVLDHPWPASRQTGALAQSTSTSTSPLFGSSRPPLRRSSAGSSQERVKL